MEEIINKIPCPMCMLILSGTAFVMGMYVCAQIERHIRANINRDKLMKNLNNGKKKKTE